jgi:hypothetical protein
LFLWTYAVRNTVRKKNKVRGRKDEENLKRVQLEEAAMIGREI